MAVELDTYSHTLTHIEVVDDDADDFDGWYCIKTDPYPCPGKGCTFVAEFVTAAHVILVWPDKDDRNILDVANKAQRGNRNPKIVEYEMSFGPAINYYEWQSHGSPIHATKWEEG